MKVQFKRFDDGFTFEVRSDPETARARREAYDAFCRFVDKADEAGLIPGRSIRRAWAKSKHKEEDASAPS